jgi:hypothetical protein
MIGATPFSIDDCFEDIGTLAILLLLTKESRAAACLAISAAQTPTLFISTAFSDTEMPCSRI